MLIDYHTHTYLCKHAEGMPEEYLAQAEAQGLSELGIADHLPWPSGYDPDCRMNASEFPKYKKIVEELRRKSRKVTVRYAVELDWVPGKMNEVMTNIRGEEFDYIIGSIHYIDSFPFDNPNAIPAWKKNSAAPDKIWDRYAELLLDFVDFGCFDIIGHPDLPKKFGFYPRSMDSFNKKMNEVFELAGKKNMAIEINTSGLRKPVKEMYPSLELLKMAKANGMLLSLGSDAHRPQDVASDFPEAIKLADDAGFDSVVSFNRRAPSLVPLG
ncbi:MAG: hypothetical protein A2017_19330 [Lentisphaerae bacterium GWF2_44_16]|nr:MAG: hypothetical protein A2017_19330 [Lentisphaerae bacterium GWF2_44_16]